MTEITMRSDLKVDYLQHMGSDNMVVNAARASLTKKLVEPGEKEGVINYLYDEPRAPHSSPSEHQVLTVRVEVPISVARQWMRHRTQSYSELSMRFREALPSFYTPAENRPLHNYGSGARPDIGHHPEHDNLHGDIAARRANVRREDWEQYKWEIEQGVAEEVARDNLPVSTYTAYWATANLNNWFKFLTLRNGDYGKPQWEIVEVAKKVEAIIEELYPITYKAWRESQ